MPKKNILILLVLISTQLFASGGSLYSRYGLGDLYFSNSGMTLSLGGYGTSTIGNKYININNPAVWSDIKYTKFGAGVLSNTSNLDDGVDKASYTHVQFSGFQIGFPIERDLGIGFVLGLTPYSVVNYEVINQVENTNFDNYNENFTGNGGLTKVFFGFGFLLPLDISVGATFNYFTGNFQYSSSVLYEDSSNLLNANYTSEYKNKGLGTTLGFESPDLSKLLGWTSITNLRIGGTYEINGEMNADTALIATTSLGENIFSSGSSFTKIPERLALGLSLNFSEKYLLIFDYIFQPWSKFELNGITTNHLKDLNRYSVGIEYGKQDKKYGSFWELVKFRGGLSYEQSQYEINGEGINQLGLHAGFSFPLGLENSIDIGFMYGIRGKNDNGLVKEDILRASFSLNFGENWFFRRDR